MESNNSPWTEQLILDYRKCDLPANLRALCDFAVKLSLTPGDMSQADVDQLRELGWTDQQITIATQVISYFNYINRIADGLGVESEEWMSPDKNSWLREKGRDYLVAAG